MNRALERQFRFLCCLRQPLPGALFRELFEKGYLPSDAPKARIRGVSSVPLRFTRDLAQRVARNESVAIAEIVGQDFTFETGVVSQASFHFVQWSFDSPRDWPPKLVEIFCADGLINAAYAFDGEDVFWQSETAIATYEAFQHPLGDAQIVGDEVFGSKVDISRNYGRRELYSDFWLIAASQVWFGRQAITRIGEEGLGSLAKVGSLRWLSPELVTLNLFPWGEDPRNYRDVQALFWRCIETDLR